MSSVTLNNLRWRKSSGSNGSGNECVEVAFVPANSLWRKSSRSNGGGNECVEVAFVPEATALRDSKNPAGGMLVLPPNGWAAFRSNLTAG